MRKTITTAQNRSPNHLYAIIIFYLRSGSEKKQVEINILLTNVQISYHCLLCKVITHEKKNGTMTVRINSGPGN